MTSTTTAANHTTASTDTTPTIGHNNPPEPTAFELLVVELDDLFDEAKNFCDGAAIDSDELAEAITTLHDRIHDCGKRADALRKGEKDELDKQIAAIQAKYAPLIADNKSKRGKVVLGKEACQALLTPWRQKKAAEAAAEAARVRAIAEAEAEAARAALAASAGNLEARVEAEQQVEQAKAWGAAAKRADKAATTGLGLRTVWTATLVDAEAGLNWAYGRDAGRFEDLVKQMAAEAVRMGVRTIPGFVVTETKVAN